MIIEHFLGLIECYTEQGVCYFKNFEFNIMFMPLIYVLIFTIILYIAGPIVIKINNYFNPANTKQLLDSVYSQGEPR